MAHPNEHYSQDKEKITMNITIFNGSHKAEKGNTFVMVEAFLEGVREAGAEGEQILLARKEIRPCQACIACWMNADGQCVHHDEMPGLMQKVLASDVLGLATPIYVDNVTGIMKIFLDRLVPLADPRWEKDEFGECRHIQKYPKPTQLIGIANCGFPEQSHFQVLALLFRRMARNLHCELIAEIYRGGGALLTSSEPTIQPLIKEYKHLLRIAGKEVVEQGALSETTRNQLERPLLPLEDFSDEYMKRVNVLWDKKLS
jgi:multimeric flavodoxin WrbA